MNNQKIKILMIDDDKEDFQIIEQIVKDIIHFQYSIDWTSSYSEGLKLIGEKQHDVYLVDYKLGAKTGLELIRIAIEEGCEAPLIILTGDNNIEIDRQALKAGAADYLVKGSLSAQIMERAIRYAIANADQKKELNELNAELEERVKSRTKALEKTLAEIEKFQKELIASKNEAERAAKIAEEASLSKTHFLSSMSHEIRTPMNAILGFTKVVLNTELTPKQKEYLNAIKMSGDILIVLINDILDLAKVESGKMTFVNAPFRLSTSMSEVLQLFDAQVQGKNVTLEKEFDSTIPDVVVGDRVRLDQIILNLLSNAIKFTPEGKIILSVRLKKEDSEKAVVEFSVSDTGIGIPENKLGSIFEKFEQVSNKTSKIYGGTGLGLSIVKQFVELQGGTITVKSEINEGSVFTFTLPFSKTSATLDNENKTEKQKEIPSQQSEKKNAKILVAEDEALNQLLIETILDSFGYQMDIAKNGRLAADLLQKNNYDIVLMDMHMPEMDGIEATKYIRQNVNKTIPIIALTADVTTVDVEKCKAVGMDDYLSKPINEELLHEMIIKYLNRPLEEIGKEQATKKNAAVKHISDMTYLDTLTNGNEAGKAKLIKMYLDEIPLIVHRMKVALEKSDWPALRMASHSLVPSFALMGVDKKYEDITRTIEKNAMSEEDLDKIPEMIAEIDAICAEVCEELRNLTNVNQ